MDSRNNEDNENIENSSKREEFNFYHDHDSILSQIRKDAQIFSVKTFQPGTMNVNNPLFKLIGRNLFVQYYHDIPFMNSYFEHLSNNSPSHSQQKPISQSIWTFSPAIPTKEFSSSVVLPRNPQQLIKPVQFWTSKTAFSDNLSLIDISYRRMHSPVTESTLSYFSQIGKTTNHSHPQKSTSSDSRLQATTALCLSLLQKGSLSDTSEVLFREVSMQPSPSPLNTFLILSLLSQGHTDLAFRMLNQLFLRPDASELLSQHSGYSLLFAAARHAMELKRFHDAHHFLSILLKLLSYHRIEQETEQSKQSPSQTTTNSSSSSSSSITS